MYDKIKEDISQEYYTNIFPNDGQRFIAWYLRNIFNLDECVLCGSKQGIVTIDADKGGYICLNCLTNELIVDKKVIKMLRMYYYVNIKSITAIKVDDNVKIIINKFLDMYYDRYTGLYLKHLLILLHFLDTSESLLLHCNNNTKISTRQSQVLIYFII